MHLKSCLLFLVMVILLSKSTQAQKRSVLLNHIAITVKELNRSAAFYRDIIKLDTIPEPFKDGKHAWYKVGEHSQLHVIEAKGKVSTFKGNHICFSIASMDDFIRLLNQNKIKYENWIGKKNDVTVRPDGVKQVYIQDPDGYWLEINDDPF